MQYKNFQIYEATFQPLIGEMGIKEADCSLDKFIGARVSFFDALKKAKEVASKWQNDDDTLKVFALRNKPNEEPIAWKVEVWTSTGEPTDFGAYIGIQYGNAPFSDYDFKPTVKV